MRAGRDSVVCKSSLVVSKDLQATQATFDLSKAETLSGQQTRHSFGLKIIIYSFLIFLFSYFLIIFYYFLFIIISVSLKLVTPLDGLLDHSCDAGFNG